MEIVYRNLSELRVNPKNPRKGSKEAIERLAESIKDNPAFFEARPILVSDRTGELVIIGGERRSEAAALLKMETVPTILMSGLTEAQENEILIKDNTHAGVWDEQKLQAWDKDQLQSWNVDGVKWANPEIKVKDDNFDPKKKVKPRVNPGEIWQLGEHRLMCGDSTDAEQVAMLMDGNKVDIAFTSPPYGVNDGSIRKHQENGKADKTATNFYKSYNDTQNGWPELIEKSYLNMRNSSGQQFINIQLLADNKRELIKFSAKYADNIVDVLVWDKGHSAPQMQDNIVNNNCEFVFVFGKSNASRTMEYGQFHGTFESIIRVGVGQNKYADIHKAVFPVAFASEILRINSKAASVLDLFGGTGTTLIAAEQMNRRCFMMELDPLYCDVIIARWEQFTGKKAKKIE